MHFISQGICIGPRRRPRLRRAALMTAPPHAAERSVPTHDSGKNLSPPNDCLQAAEHPARRRSQASLISAAEPSRTADIARRC